MTAPSVINVADSDAQVGVQAGVVHGNINFYRLPPDSSPEKQFDLALKYLAARVREEASRLIERAVAGGHVTSKVQFYRLIALLSGRTLRQLGSDEADRLNSICADLVHLDSDDEWAAGLRAVIRLLAPVSPAERELVIKEIDTLGRPQRDAIYGHLEALLEGAIQDEMWSRSVALARSYRSSGDRLNRVWKFFHPEPVPPRTPKVQPAAVALRDWLRVGAGIIVFALTAAKLILLLATSGTFSGLLGLLVGMAGLTAFCVGGADRHYRLTRIRAKDAQLRPPRQRSNPPTGGFASQVDRLFNRYFGRYVPSETDRTYWLTQTAGIRRQLRDEVVELYREQRIEADRIAWLVRYLVGNVRQKWEQDTLTAYREELRVPARTVLSHAGGLALLIAGTLWATPSVVISDPLAGTAWMLLAAASAVPAARSSFRIIAERRRVADDQVEREAEDAARQAAYRRWCQKLSKKPKDTEMAIWLESDRKVMVDQVMRDYRLRPSQVIAHAFIEAPAPKCRKARYPQGPWRYSRYRLLLFLLTHDGVRQVNMDLDFQTGVYRATQRLNYRFDAVAAVRIDGVATEQQTFELTLVNGEPISIRVSEPDKQALQQDEDISKITALSLDAAGLRHTLHVLEGVAAEGKQWVTHRRQRADEKLADLATTIRALLD